MIHKHLLIVLLSGLLTPAVHSQSMAAVKLIPVKVMERYFSKHWAVNAGVWIPTGELVTVGTHPILGLQWGFRHKIHDFNLTVDFRFLNTKEPYEVMREGTIYSLNDFFGGYLGVDYICYLAVDSQIDFGILLGAGYDGFDVSVPTKPYEIDSFNFNAGIRLNLYGKGRNYLGIQPRYNFINYGNKGGTNFSGNAISLQLYFGGFKTL